ncbi:hypothetical protein [Glycomyces algeriensis]|uniref:Uncharacterized protein n=1 Tax=Glycomyces algeriensis TaxID=256037 RepID=A0A9W6LFM1_9ACTN|nr:hypothetical protein [Glycomyces algeriensis]MDA1367574.1 hypothetical protein [Glycomyces algeriensis]MDR7353063.1 putative RNase H-like HicB family nuclease [Glycomyces algeriensis]GLI40754.1 hypothetical protein GALLR39Z86_06040 [Glycomyces algeriensis]
MNWLNDAGEWISDQASDAREWVSDQASDALDSAVETGRNAWDAVTDWVTGDDAPVTPVDLDGAPTEDQMWEALDSIREVLLEGYRRQEAFDRFGHDVALRHVGNLALYPMEGGFAEAEGQQDWRTLTGFYRHSEVLGFLMPAAIPDAVAESFSNGPQIQSTWTGTTASDDDDVHNQAMGRTIVQMGSIEEAYRDMLKACDLPAMGDLLTKLNAVCEQAKTIHDTHVDRECLEIRALWDEWQASEIEQPAVQDFGNQVRQALVAHWNGASALVYAGSAEATAQTHAVVQAYNNIAEAWELILEKLNSSSAQDKAVSKFAATITVNRIPFAGDIVATTDFVVEAASGGEVQSPMSNFFNGIIDRLTGKDVPDGDTCAELVKMLTEGAEDCLEGLEESRKDYSGGFFESEALVWDGYFSNSLVYQIIPGYING